MKKGKEEIRKKGQLKTCKEKGKTRKEGRGEGKSKVDHILKKGLTEGRN